MKQATFFFKQSKYLYYARSLSSPVRYLISLFVLILLSSIWFYAAYSPLMSLLDNKRLKKEQLITVLDPKRDFFPEKLRRILDHKKSVVASYKECNLLEQLFSLIEKHELKLEGYAPGNFKTAGSPSFLTHNFTLYGPYKSLMVFLEELFQSNIPTFCVNFAIKQQHEAFVISIELSECIKSA